MSYNEKQMQVMDGLAAIAETMANSTTEGAVRMYCLVYDGLSTAEQKQALKDGALSMAADLGGMDIRRKSHKCKFDRKLQTIK